MNQFIKLFLIYPLLLIPIILIFAGSSIDYLEQNKTTEVKINTFDVCESAPDFQSCVIKKHEPLSRFINCISEYPAKKLAKELKFGPEYRVGNLEYIDSILLQGCYGGYTIPRDSLVHYKRAAELIKEPNLFKDFIKVPGKLCDGDIKNYQEFKSNKKGMIRLKDQFNLCDELGNPTYNTESYIFSHYKNKFLWKKLLRYLTFFFIPSTLALIFFWRNKSVIATLLQDQQTYSWLLIKRKFRTALVLSLAWLALFFIVLFSQADFSGFNPLTESGASGLWFVYLFSFYPLMTLLISYFIYSADNE